VLEANIIKKMPGFDLKVSLSCEGGKLMVITGPSGAGKTTLIRILAGLEQADAGFIKLNNDTWFNSTSKVLLSPQKRKIGYVFQEHTLFPHLSVLENITFTNKDPQQANDLLSMFRIRHIANNMPHQISGGERQRVAFAQALARRPEVLLLDEPFSALDFDTRYSLQKELKKLKKLLSVPIIHVTHDPAETEMLADSVLHVERDFALQQKPAQLEKEHCYCRKMNLCTPTLSSNSSLF